MIQFVLENHGREPGDLLFPGFAVFVDVADPDLLPALHIPISVRNRETTLPARLLFAAHADDFGIQEEFEGLARFVETLYGNDPPQDPHLRGGDSDAFVFGIPHGGQHASAQRGIRLPAQHSAVYGAARRPQHRFILPVSEDQHPHRPLPGGDHPPLLAGEIRRASRQQGQQGPGAQQFCCIHHAPSAIRSRIRS